jgi:hypothetical protein
LQAKLRHYFNDPAYPQLLYYLCHVPESTYARKQHACNKLEWLGDRVLGLVIGEWLFALSESGDLESNRMISVVVVVVVVVVGCCCCCCCSLHRSHIVDELHQFAAALEDNMNNEKVFEELDIAVSVKKPIPLADIIEVG